MAKSYPSAKYVEDLAGHLERQDQPDSDAYEAVEERRFMRKLPQVPKQFEKTAVKAQSGAIYETMRRSVAIMAAAFPVPKVTPIGIGKQDQANSSKREKWLAAAWRKLDTDNGVYAKTLDSVMGGRGTIKILVKRKEWGVLQNEDEDADKYLSRRKAYHRMHFPFQWEHVDFRTYHEVNDGDGLCEVVEITTRDTLPLMRQYSLAYNNEGKLRRVPRRGWSAPEGTYQSQTRFIEYWNRNVWMRLIDGEIVEQGSHPYGRPPYFSCYSGHTSSKRKGEEHPSFAYSLIHAQDLLDSLKTIRLNWAYYTAFPPFVPVPVSDDVPPLDPDVMISIIQGELVNVPPGYKLDVLRLPPVGNELQAMYEETKRELDNLSLAPILQGILPGSDVSGTAAMSMIAVAKSIFAPATESIARMFDDMAAFMQERIEKDLKEPVPVWMVQKKGKKEAGEYFELGPDDIEGYYEVRHALHPVLPAERYQKSLWMADAGARGYVDKNTVREEGYGFEAPEELEKRVRIDSFRDTPQWWNFLMTKLAERLKMMQPVAPQGTPAGMPTAPGGPGAAVVPGINRPSDAEMQMRRMGA